MKFASLSVALLLCVTSFAFGQKRKKSDIPPPPPKPPLPDQAALSAKTAVLIDEISGKVLWSKNPDVKRFPASTTKIMTALLLIERCTPDEVVTAPPDIEKVGEASLHLKPGEKLTMRDLIWGILLRSGNDGCVAGAIHCAGSVEAFAALMNERAKQLGCTNTNFTNPNGLKDPEHFTTAHDLALIAREAMRYPEFREVVKQRKHTIERSINIADRLIVSKNKWLDFDKTADGIKTGYTKPAGLCFVGSASRGGYRLISVVLGSDNWLEDTAKVINWGFNTHEVVRQLRAGQALEERAPIVGGTTVSVGPVRAARFVGERGQSGATLVPKFFEGIRAPIAKGQQLGSLLLTDPSGWRDSIPLVALEDVPGRATGTTSRVPFLVGGVFLITLYAFTRRKRQQLYGRFLVS